MDATPTLTTRQRRLLLAVLALILFLGGLVVVAPLGSNGSAAQDRSASHVGTRDRAAATTSTTSLLATAPGAAADGAAAADPDPEVGTGESPEDDMPEVPDEDDEDPGPWYPPNHGIDDFATPPLVLDLVAPVDP